MTSGPNIWNISEIIYVELFVVDPNTSAGKTGEAANIVLTIQRGSDSKYWTGSAWSATLTSLVMTEKDATNQKGRYTYTLSAVANAQADRYICHTIVTDLPDFDSQEDYEIHVSRDLTVDTYSIEPA